MYVAIIKKVFTNCKMLPANCEACVCCGRRLMLPFIPYNNKKPLKWQTKSVNKKKKQLFLENHIKFI